MNSKTQRMISTRKRKPSVSGTIEQTTLNIEPGGQPILGPPRMRLPHPSRFSKGGHCGPCPSSFVPSLRFPQSPVTSDLVSQIQFGDHGRGRDGWHKPTWPHESSSKLFEIRILPADY